MPDALMAILRAHRHPAGFIITDHEGKLFTKSRYKKFWSNLKEYIGIPDLDARQLRHTYATMTHAAGVESGPSEPAWVTQNPQQLTDTLRSNRNA